MSRTSKQVLQFGFEEVNETRYSRKLNPGQMTGLKNVRRPKEAGPPVKRYGNTPTTIATFEGGTYAGPATELIPHGSTLIVRDSDDQIWAKNGAEARLKGSDLGRVFPSYQSLTNLANEGRAHKPLLLRRGDELWHFELGVAETSLGAIGYQLTVLDAATRQPIYGPERIGALGPLLDYAVAVDASDNVWVFSLPLSQPTKIRAHKWTSAGSFASSTDFATQSGASFTSVAAAYDETSGETIVVATSAVVDSPMVLGHWHGLLDSSTGAAKASPAPVFTTVSGGDPGSQRSICAGVKLARHDGANGDFYYAFGRAVLGGDPFDVDIVRVKASVSTLAISTTVTLETVDVGNGTDDEIACIGGFIDGSTETWVSTIVGVTGGTDIDRGVTSGDNNVSSAVTRKHVFNGSTTNSDFARGAILAGGPVERDGSWFWLTSFGDDAKTQRSYYLRDNDGNLIVPILDGEAPEPFHNGGLAGVSDGILLYSQSSGHVVDLILDDDDNILAPLLREGLTREGGQPVIATLDFGATWHSSAPGIIPSGIPKVVGPNDEVTECAPLQFPAEPLEIINDGTEPGVHSTNVATLRYFTQDAGGKLSPSATGALQTLEFHDYTVSSPDYTLRVPTLRHTIGPCYIGVYGSPNGELEPVLQRVIANRTDVDFIDLTVQPASWTGTGEALDTLGGAVEPAPLPSARIAFVHRDRLWLAGTPYDSVFPSQEFEAGRQPEFNEVLSFDWRAGQGPVTAGCSLNNDVALLFRQNAIAAVVGPGPDGNGSQGYQPQTIATDKGTTNPASVARTPIGVVFQCHQDSRIYLCQGGPPFEISKGIDTFIRSETVTAVVSDETNRMLTFFCASGRKLNFDLARPTLDQPGQWYVDESDYLTANPAVGASIIGGTVTALTAGESDEIETYAEDPGSYDDDTAEVLPDMTTGPLAPGGVQGEFDVLECHLSSVDPGSGSETWEITLTDDRGNGESHSDTGLSSVAFWSGIDRTREVTMRLRATSSEGPGRVLDSISMEVGIYPGRVQSPFRRIA